MKVGVFLNNKEIYKMIKDYTWMKNIVEESDRNPDMYKTGIETLKNKLEFVDKGLQNVKNHEGYWLLNLLKTGYSVTEIRKLRKISNGKFYRQCDAAIELMKNKSKVVIK